jgi:cytochrome c oxidase subunit III
MPGDVETETLQLNGAGRGAGGGAAFGNNGQGGWRSGTAGVPQRAYATGMIIALAGILMFFAALVSAYVVRKGFPNSDWQALAVPRILWLNTLVLLASSFTLARSRRYLLAGDDAGFRHWWGVTAILGVLFLVGQLVAWRQLVVAGIYLATNPSSGFFYVFTAAHGLHLLGGIAALLAVGFRLPRRLERSTAVDVASMYWHFMDGLWLFLFVFLLVGS